MDRRSFIKSLSFGAGGCFVDPDELLWRPVKTIFIPENPVVSQFLTWDEISAIVARKMTATLVNLVYKPSPFMSALKNHRKEIYDGGKEIITPFSSSPIYEAAVVQRQIDDVVNTISNRMGIGQNSYKTDSEWKLFGDYAGAMHRP